MTTIRTILAVRPTPHSTTSATVMQTAACWVQRVTSTVFIVTGAEQRTGDNVNLYRFLKMTFWWRRMNRLTLQPFYQTQWSWGRVWDCEHRIPAGKWSLVINPKVEVLRNYRNSGLPV